MDPILKRRRVVEEEWVVPPEYMQGQLGDVEELNEEFDDLEDERDHDLGDPDRGPNG